MMEDVRGLTGVGSLRFIKNLRIGELNKGTMAIDFKLLNALTKARQVYGDNYLIDLAIEEMGELIVALNHHRRKRVEASAVQEEIADVMLALKELQQIFGTGDIVDFYRKKCERFEQRVEEKDHELQTVQ